LENFLAALGLKSGWIFCVPRREEAGAWKTQSWFCGCPTYAIWITGTKHFWGQMTDILENVLNGIQGATKQSKLYYVLVLLLALNA
jgi:hypothetical protein